MEYFVNGEIYLKRGPEVFDASEKISDLEFKIANAKTIEEIKKYREDLQLKMMFQEACKGKLDYSGTDDFWQAYINSNGEITIFSNTGRKKTFKSISDLENKFIKLDKFLDKATFVGRELKRAKSTVIFDGSCYKTLMKTRDNFSQYTILYVYQDLLLTKRLWLDEYDLISSRYLEDGNYEFFGPVYEEYADKDKMYSEILAQVTGEVKKRHL